MPLNLCLCIREAEEESDEEDDEVPGGDDSDDDIGFDSTAGPGVSVPEPVSYAALVLIAGQRGR